MFEQNFGSILTINFTIMSISPIFWILNEKIKGKSSKHEKLFVLKRLLIHSYALIVVQKIMFFKDFI